MNASAGLGLAGLDLTELPNRIQSEVQRAIQRSIKGVEYFSTSGPSLGSTPKDILHVRGTMNLYHYRPVADEIYRVPILIVIALGSSDARDSLDSEVRLQGRSGSQSTAP